MQAAAAGVFWSKTASQQQPSSRQAVAALATAAATQLEKHICDARTSC